jgi:hypothetical protein
LLFAVQSCICIWKLLEKDKFVNIVFGSKTFQYFVLVLKNPSLDIIGKSGIEYCMVFICENIDKECFHMIKITKKSVIPGPVPGSLHYVDKHPHLDLQVRLRGRGQ